MRKPGNAIFTHHVWTRNSHLTDCEQAAHLRVIPLPALELLQLMKSRRKQTECTVCTHLWLLWAEAP